MVKTTEETLQPADLLASCTESYIFYEPSPMLSGIQLL